MGEITPNNGALSEALSVIKTGGKCQNLAISAREMSGIGITGAFQSNIYAFRCKNSRWKCEKTNWKFIFGFGSQWLRLDTSIGEKMIFFTSETG